MSFSVAPFLILAVSLVLVLVGAWVLLRHKWVWQWIKGTAGLVLVALAVYLVLVALNLYSFHELNEETPVATISFRATGEQSYIATVTREDGGSEDFRLNGDQWQLDARVVKWKTLHAAGSETRLSARPHPGPLLRPGGRALQGTHRVQPEPEAPGHGRVAPGPRGLEFPGRCALW